MKKNKCETCKHFWCNTKLATEGYCRRYPPVPMEFKDGEWPVVQKLSWCGEYQRSEDIPEFVAHTTDPVVVPARTERIEIPEEVPPGARAFMHVRLGDSLLSAAWDYAVDDKHIFLDINQVSSKDTVMVITWYSRDQRV